MGYDEDLAERVRFALAGREDVDERKMFGGVAFMVGGHMTVGIVGDELMARVGAEGEEDALAQEHARPMDFTGRPMTGFVFVGAPAVAGDAGVAAWVTRALSYTSTLPPKRPTR
jgi:TfoX-like protein